jgi:hypothetical protein
MVKFGTDLTIENGDLAITNSGDLMVNIDRLNIGQAIQNILYTEFGNLKYNLEYGVDITSYLGTKNLKLQRLLLGTAIKRAILNDPRVADVPSLTIRTNPQNPSQIDISITIQLVNVPQPQPFNFVYPFVPFYVENEQIVETLTSIDANTVNTTYNIYRVNGVFLSTDVERTTNYFTGGYITESTITLGMSLPLQHTTVIVDYQTTDLEATYEFKQTSEFVIPFGNVYYEIVSKNTIWVSQVNDSAQENGLRILFDGLLETQPNAETFSICFFNMESVGLSSFYIEIVDTNNNIVKIPLDYSDEDLLSYGIIIDRTSNCVKIEIKARTIMINNFIRNQGIITNSMVFE